jgi:lysophospholipase L1-like esterase
MKRLLLIASLFCTTVCACKKQTIVKSLPQAPPRDTVVIPPALPPIDTPILSSNYYLALGDSYTIGQSVAITECFPVQTVEKLKTISVFFNDPEIIAQTGWTTGNLLNRITTTPPMHTKYDIVTLLIGVNNQYQRQSQLQYATEFRSLLNKAIVYANNKPNRVFVLSIPDYSVTPFANGSNQMLISNQIDSFNTINQQITQLLGAHYLYITNSTRLAAIDRTLIAIDDLHPSGKEYKKWSDSLAPMIKRALQ